jgi:hypothetical protein
MSPDLSAAFAKPIYDEYCFDNKSAGFELDWEKELSCWSRNQIAVKNSAGTE